VSAIAACTVLTPRPDPSRFFVLTPLGDPPASSGQRLASLGIGPVSLPRYLDRSEVVTRVAPNEVKPAVFDYWAGSLSRQFEAVLAQNLQSLVGAERVQSYPWYSGSVPELVVEVDVLRFESSSDGRAELAARWRVRKGSARESLRAGETTLSRQADGTDPASGAAALSGLLGDFSRELAQVIQTARADGVAQRAQRGGRLSKKAAMPSCPSSPARILASISAV
jgi:uncharacterized lipoprotein YmbA